MKILIVNNIVQYLKKAWKKKQLKKKLKDRVGADTSSKYRKADFLKDKRRKL